jgi:hypothetical protein
MQCRADVVQCRADVVQCRADVMQCRADVVQWSHGATLTIATRDLLTALTGGGAGAAANPQGGVRRRRPVRGRREAVRRVRPQRGDRCVVARAARVCRWKREGSAEGRGWGYGLSGLSGSLSRHPGGDSEACALMDHHHRSSIRPSRPQANRRTEGVESARAGAYQR